jgi:hypothetical protein
MTENIAMLLCEGCVTRARSPRIPRGNFAVHELPPEVNIQLGLSLEKRIFLIDAADKNDARFDNYATLDRTWDDKPVKVCEHIGGPGFVW